MQALRSVHVAAADPHVGARPRHAEVRQLHVRLLRRRVTGETRALRRVQALGTDE